jgi:hypothetical protein
LYLAVLVISDSQQAADATHPPGRVLRRPAHCRTWSPVPDEELELVSVVAEVQQVASLLGHPLPRRMGGDTCQLPAQQGTRGDDQAKLANLAIRQQPGQRGQHRPVGPRHPRRLDLPLEHGDLMAQDQDLRVLGPVGAGEQGEPAEHAQHRQVSESHRHEYRQCLTVRPARSQTPNPTIPRPA